LQVSPHVPRAGEAPLAANHLFVARKFVGNSLFFLFVGAEYALVQNPRIAS